MEVKIKSRTVTVKGPRGVLRKIFKHIQMELTKVGRNRIRVDLWFSNRKQQACMQTICSHLNNMFKGVIYVSTFQHARTLQGRRWALFRITCHLAATHL